MSIRLKLTLLLVFLFTASIGNTVFTFLLESYGEEKLKWMIHTQEVIFESEKLLSTMTDAETGQRGFLLTGNPSYLEPYHFGVLSARKHLDELLKLTADNATQQKRLKGINELMKKKFEELKVTIELSQKGNNREALKIVNQDLGKTIMDNIRNQLVAFKNEERILLEKRDGDYRESRAQITTLMTIEILFFIFLGLLTALFVKGNLFNPLKLLLLNTSKMERGERQEVSDLLPANEMGYLLSRFYQMSEKVLEKTEILDYSAKHDELTGLKNRAELYDLINDSIARLENLDTKMAVIFIDLNKFKQLNDSLGHDAGDLVLKETAIRLEASVRSEDVVFRQGGDEFVLVINNISDASQVEKIVTKIIDRFKQPVMFSGNSISILLSIGIAISPDDTSNADEMIKFSDVAMYEAKRDIIAEYKFFNPGMLKRGSDLSSQNLAKVNLLPPNEQG